MKSPQIISTATAILLALSGTSAAHANEDNNFEGIKAGVQAGWEQRKIDVTLLPAPNAFRLTDKSNGISYSGFVGYDAQFDKIVIGVEGDFSPDGKTLRSTTTAGGSIELDSKWNASVSARAGVAVTPKLLAYGRLGYDLNRYTIRGFAPGNITAVATERATGGGLLYGGGLEYAFNRNASFRVEYRRRDQERSLGTNQVLGGLTLRF